jgi:hypothetical protein
MNSVDFCFWLQGFFEISEQTNLSPRQIEIVKAHLNLVFLHEIDPMCEAETTTTKSNLNAVHNGQKPTLVGPATAILPNDIDRDPKPYQTTRPGGYYNGLKLR